MLNRSTRRLLQVSIALMLVALMGFGCQQPHEKSVVEFSPTLAADELGVGHVHCPPTGYVILEQEPSTGRFPCALAVAKLTSKGPKGLPPSPPITWTTGTIPEQEATYWTALFNQIRPIREVVMLDRHSVPQISPAMDEVIDAARLAKADLCVIWGTAAAAAGEAKLVGVVKDTIEGTYVAFVQAHADPSDYLQPTPDQIDGDQRHRDVEYLVRRKFTKTLRQCVIELIERDKTTSSTKPSPWKSAVHRHNRGVVPVYVVPNRPTD
jgi:hypothetical protein